LMWKPSSSASTHWTEGLFNSLGAISSLREPTRSVREGEGGVDQGRTSETKWASPDAHLVSGLPGGRAEVCFVNFFLSLELKNHDHMCPVPPLTGRARIPWAPIPHRNDAIFRRTQISNGLVLGPDQTGRGFLASLPYIDSIALTSNESIDHTQCYHRVYHKRMGLNNCLN